MPTTLRGHLLAHKKFVAANELAELHMVPEPYEQKTDTVDESYPHLVVRLVCWQGDHASGIRQIVDVKEQLIHMPTSLSPELANHGGRTTNFVTALRRVLREVLCSKDVGARMPRDLLPFDPLGKKTFGTVEEFERALRTKGRLGGLL